EWVTSPMQTCKAIRDRVYKELGIDPADKTLKAAIKAAGLKWVSPADRYTVIREGLRQRIEALEGTTQRLEALEDTAQQLKTVLDSLRAAQVHCADLLAGTEDGDHF